MPRTRTKAPSKTPTNAPSWPDCLDRYRQHQVDNERSRHTRRNYRTDLEAFRAWYEESNKADLETITQVNAVQSREWRQAMKDAGLATATINRRLSAMGSFLRWAYHARLIPEQVDRAKSIKETRLGHRGLERKQERDLLSEAEGATPRDRAVIHILLYTGLRVQELADLKWRDLRLSERKGVIKVRQGKGNKERDVPVIPKTRAALEILGLAEHRGSDRHVVYGPRGPLKVRAIQAIVEQFGISAHMLRHTFAHKFLKAGGGLEELATILGHDDINTTRRYVIPSGGDLQTAMDRMGAED